MNAVDEFDADGLRELSHFTLFGAQIMLGETFIPQSEALRGDASQPRVRGRWYVIAAALALAWLVVR